ncbi:MAG: D-2-hydroxyacid dehydrogenase [Candidatus Aenigmarchaeota archaeon]|nr:D-2-hydroxyacid dehydrogenase [Candidatus Aenigmarchaeota archaeon]
MYKILLSPRIKLSGENKGKMRSSCSDIEFAQSKDADETKSLLKDADIFLTFPMDFPKDFSEEMAPKLKWIHTMSAGVDKFMVPGLVHSDIILTNSSGIHAIPISEHVLGMILAFERNLHISRDYQNRGEWHRFAFEEMSELDGKTVAVIGLGEIGLRTAKLLKAFGTKIIAVKRTAGEKPEFIDELYTQDELGGVLPASDYVIICTPYTKETHHMFDSAKLKKMKEGSIIINIGRGGIIDEKALVEELKKKRLKGAGLDVFEAEPLPADSPLYGMENVILTPHVSGYTPHYADRALGIFCENLKLFAGNNRMINVVDKKEGY